MSSHRQKEIEHHLSETKIDEKLVEADDEKIVRRLSFLKNLYQGDTIKEAANRVGRSESTGDRWADSWNKSGLDELAPSFGGGRPPKLTETEQQQLKEMLRDGQPWKSQEIQHLINEEFGVEYHQDYLSTFLRNLGLTYSIPRTKRPSQPDNAEELLDERLDEALVEDDDAEPHNKREGDDEDGWTLDDDVCTDGGTVLGFFDASHPQPYDNSHRMWYVDDRHLE